MNRQILIPSLRCEGAPAGSKPVMAYPIAGKPLCLHYLETVSSLVDGSLAISVGDKWFDGVPSLLKEMGRFGKVEPTSDVPSSSLDYPLQSGEVIRVNSVWDVLTLAEEILASMVPSIAASALIESGVEISGRVVIEDGAKVMSGTRLKGDIYIGPNSTIGNGALVRGSTSIGKNSLIGFNTEIKSSVLLDDVIVGPTSAVPDCVIEDRAFLGGLVRISNTNLRFAPVQVRRGNEFVDSGRKFLGAFVGADAAVAGGVRIAPGRIVGQESEIGPGLVIANEVSPGSRLRLKQEIVSIEPKITGGR